MVKSWSFTKFGDADLLFDYKDADDPFLLEIPHSIVNNSGQTLFFKASLSAPPAPYTNIAKQLGSVASGASAYVIFNTSKRTRPSVSTDETLTLKMEAFTESTYTTAFADAPDATLALTVRLRDHAALTLVDKDDFDNNDAETWAFFSNRTIKGNGFADTANYFSAPYSRMAVKEGASGGTEGVESCRATKSFTIGVVTRAFIVIHLNKTVSGVNPTYIKIGGTLKLPSQALAQFGLNRWIRLMFSLPINATTEVRIANELTGNGLDTVLMDEIWVITE